MPHFFDIKKYYHRRVFFQKIYDVKAFVKVSPELQNIFSPIDIKISQEQIDDGMVSLGILVSNWIGHVQFAMINQDEETQQFIADAAVSKLLSCLKEFYKLTHPNDLDENLIGYWSFINESLKASFLTNFNPKAIQDFIEAGQLLASLLFRVHPRIVYATLDRVKQITKLLEMPVKATKITNDLRQKSMQNVIDAFYERTSMHTLPAITLLSLAVVLLSLFLKVPFLFTGSMFMLLGSIMYPVAYYRLNTSTENYFIKIDRTHHEKSNVDNLKENTFKRKIQVQNGIRISLNNISLSRQLTKKKIYSENKKQPLREVYVPLSDNFSTMADIAPPPLKKPNKVAIAQTAQETPLTEPETKKPRVISLPDNTDLRLIEGDNGSLMLLKPPAENSNISKEKIEQMLGPRGAIFAKKFGQSGMKRLSHHAFWLKDKNTNERLVYEAAGEERLSVDGKEQVVPMYQPTRLIHK